MNERTWKFHRKSAGKRVGGWRKSWQNTGGGKKVDVCEYTEECPCEVRVGMARSLSLEFKFKGRNAEARERRALARVARRRAPMFRRAEVVSVDTGLWSGFMDFDVLKVTKGGATVGAENRSSFLVWHSAQGEQRGNRAKHPEARRAAAAATAATTRVDGIVVGGGVDGERGDVACDCAVGIAHTHTVVSLVVVLPRIRNRVTRTVRGVG